MISLGLKNEQFLNDSPLEENIIGFKKTSQKFRVTENRDLKGSGEQI